LKVGGQWAPVSREAPEFFSVAPLHFLALKVQLVVLVRAFVVVSTNSSLVSFFFAFLLLTDDSRCPLCPAICKRGGGERSPCPMESAPLLTCKSCKSCNVNRRRSYGDNPRWLLPPSCLRKKCSRWSCFLLQGVIFFCGI